MNQGQLHLPWATPMSPVKSSKRDSVKTKTPDDLKNIPPVALDCKPLFGSENLPR
jgi:hypothetical protein